mmetsp:Transcript_18128/g.33123  ORF Transcript_18128/g.33123 Transcript_18128/m.33123 type:complete len:204 (+) Transcript_18128:546-1157(+)
MPKSNWFVVSLYLKTIAAARVKTLGHVVAMMALIVHLSLLMVQIGMLIIDCDGSDSLAAPVHMVIFKASGSLKTRGVEEIDPDVPYDSSRRKGDGCPWALPTRLGFQGSRWRAKTLGFGMGIGLVIQIALGIRIQATWRKDPFFFLRPTPPIVPPVPLLPYHLPYHLPYPPPSPYPPLAPPHPRSTSSDWAESTVPAEVYWTV